MYIIANPLASIHMQKISLVSILDEIFVVSILCGGVLEKHLLSTAISNMPVYIQNLPVKSHSCLCSPPFPQAT